MKSKWVCRIFHFSLYTFLLLACTNPIMEQARPKNGNTPVPTIPVTYTVDFDSKGGSPVDSQPVAEGEKATRPPNPAKNGYGFVNWYDNGECAGDCYDFETPVTDDITLYAEWNKTFHTVIFMDGEREFDNQVVGENGTASRPAQDPSKSGYDFVNWYSDPELTAVYDFATPVTAGITLYARWIDADFPGEVIHNTFNVSNIDEWNSARSAIGNGGDDKNYIINVIADFDIPGIYADYVSFGNASGIKVSLRGVGRTLTLSRSGSMLRISDGQTFILRDLILQGYQMNGESVVYVKGGTKEGTFIMQSGKICRNYDTGVGLYEGGIFIMNGGEISGNTDSGVDVDQGTFIMNGGIISGNTVRHSGGGVYVWKKGTFTMNGGIICGNTAYSDGGGVYVYQGTFTMHGGEISGNTAHDSGGGVYVDRQGTFTMYGGEISGNTADRYGGGVYNCGTFRIVTGTIHGLDSSLRNSAMPGYSTGGSALYNENAVQAEYGKFSGTEWLKTGNLYTEDWNATHYTIRVENGFLLQGKWDLWKQE